MNIERTGQFSNADPRLLLHYTKCPKLRAPNAGGLFDMAKMSFNSVEDNTKLPQHSGRWREIHSVCRTDGSFFSGIMIR